MYLYATSVYMALSFHGSPLKQQRPKVDPLGQGCWVRPERSATDSTKMLLFDQLWIRPLLSTSLSAYDGIWTTKRALWPHGNRVC